MVINQPSNQIKHTNLAIVRIRKGKKRFEIACYPNKVQDWRKKIETDIKNVLQKEDTVFVHVGKGEVASRKDLAKAFENKPLQKIIEEILDNGELQVGGKERQADQDRTRHEVIDIVAGRLVDPKTKRVYTSGLIEKALDQLSSNTARQQAEKKDAASNEPGADTEKEKHLPKWSGVIPNKKAKSQALFAIKCLIAHQPIPVMRARMKLKVTCATQVLKFTAKTAAKSPETAGATDESETPRKTIKETILTLFENTESEEVIGDEWEVIGFVEPGNYKSINDLIGSQTKGRGRVEVLEAAIVHEDD